jgi:outer membrane receptor protein involved in Fe transport
MLRRHPLTGRTLRLRRTAETALALAFVLGARPPLAAAQSAPAERLDQLLSVRVSTASRLDNTAMRAPASVTVITAEDIARFGYRTLAEVLRSVAGFYLSYDRNYAYVGVRGFSRPTDYNDRILLLIDGFRLNEGVYGEATFGTGLPIDLGAVDRIEIVRGPGSAAFGGEAMLAVVNVILRKAAAAKGSEAGVEAGSFGLISGTIHGAAEAASGAGFAGSLKMFDTDGPNLFYPEYDSPETQLGRTRGTDWERGSGFTAAMTYQDLEVTALLTSRDKGIPTGAFETDFGDREAASSDSWMLLGARWKHEISKSFALTAGGSVGNYSYDGVYPSEGVRYQDSTDNDWWSAELAGQWTPAPAHRLLVGVEMRHNSRADYRSFDDQGNIYFDGDFPYDIRSIYAEHEFQVNDRLLISGGLRYDDYTRGGGSTNPRLALVAQPTDRDTLKLIYGRAFRPPNVYELFYEDIDVAKGNPRLDPERVATVEVEWQRRWSGGISGSLALYHSRIDDLIDQEVDPADGLLQFRNQSSATSRGIELQLRARAGERSSAYAGLAVQSTEDASGEELTNSPEKQARAGFSTSLGRSWMGAVEALFESGRRTVQGSSTDSFVLVDVNLSWSPNERPLSVSLKVCNLGDQRYSYPGGFEHRQASIEQDGRTFWLRLGYRFR